MQGMNYKERPFALLLTHGISAQLHNDFLSSHILSKHQAQDQAQVKDNSR